MAENPTIPANFLTHTRNNKDLTKSGTKYVSQHSETVTQGVTHGLARYAQQQRVSARGNHRQKPKY